MKKIIVSILLISYAFASSGASVDLHYCMGKIIGWDLDYVIKNDCSNCSMKINPAKGCCDNKQISAKIDKEQQAVYNNISFDYDHIALLPAFFLFNQNARNSTGSVHPSIHAPPLINTHSLYLFNCNFRI